MIRRLFNLLSILSLLLGIGLGCLWERSMQVYDQLAYVRSSGQSVTLGTPPRQFCLFVESPWGDPPNDPPGRHYRSYQMKPQIVDKYLAMMWNDSWLGFKLHGEDHPYQGGGWHIITVYIPLWFPMVLTLIAPLCWLRRWRRQARRVCLGLCLHCGYDLRASPECCPECGSPVPAAHIPKVSP